MTDFDDETLARMKDYCGGRDPREPQIITDESLSEYNAETWTFDEFKALMAEVPEQYRGTALVDFEPGDCRDTGGRLLITYQRPETVSEVAEKVQRALAYVRQKQELERAQYEYFRRKYGNES